MDELPARVRALKHELKDWEHGFEREWGRKPTKEDIVAASDGDSHDKDSLVYKFKLYAKLKAQLELLSQQDLSSRRTDSRHPDSTETAYSTKRSPAKFHPPSTLVPKPIVTGRSPIVASPPKRIPEPEPEPEPEVEAESVATEDSEYEDDIRSEADAWQQQQQLQQQQQQLQQHQQLYYEDPRFRTMPRPHPGQQQQQQQLHQAYPPQAQPTPTQVFRPQQMYAPQQQQQQQQQQMMMQAQQQQQLMAAQQMQYAQYGQPISTRQLQSPNQPVQGSFIGVSSVQNLAQDAHRPSTASLGVSRPVASQQQVIAQQQQQLVPQPNPIVQQPVVLGPFGLPWSAHPVMGGGFGVRGFGEGLFKRLPPNTLLRCTVYRRTRFGQSTYHLHNETDGDAFMLAARRRRKTKGIAYLIGTDPVVLKRGLGGGQGGYVGKLRANPQRTMFVLYDARSYDPVRSDKGLKERMLVEYVCEDWSRTALPREMHVGIPALTLPDPEERTGTPDIVTDYRMHDTNRLAFYRNKPPRWNAGTQSHCLNFGGRVTEASIKNFQLVSEAAVSGASAETGSTDDMTARPIMQFGRTGSDTFTLDVMWPLSVVEAFGLALSTFDAYDAS